MTFDATSFKVYVMDGGGNKVLVDLDVVYNKSCIITSSDRKYIRVAKFTPLTAFMILLNHKEYSCIIEGELNEIK